MERDILIKILKDNYVKVIFTKRDGTERTMICTLISNVIEKLFPPSDNDKPKRQSSLETIVCIDVEKQEWRSFRLDSIISFEVLSDYDPDLKKND